MLEEPHHLWIAASISSIVFTNFSSLRGSDVEKQLRRTAVAGVRNLFFHFTGAMGRRQEQQERKAGNNLIISLIYKTHTHALTLQTLRETAMLVREMVSNIATIPRIGKAPDVRSILCYLTGRTASDLF